MKIVFDNIIYSLQNSGGGSVYWTELIKRFNTFHKDEVLFFEQKEPNFNIFRKNLEIGAVKKETFLWLKIRRYLNFTKPIKEKSIFHSSYFRVSKSKNAINVVTLHDFTAEKFRTGLPRWINLMQKQHAVRNSHGIVCISENTKKDLMYFMPDTDQSKIKVIYNGISDDYFKIDEEYNISSKDHIFLGLKNYKYLLYIGLRTSYKNFPIAVEVASRFRNKYKLVVVGEPLNNNEKAMAKEKLGNDYFVVSNLDNKGVNLLYNKAFALLYTSSYEGFGIPLIEAMKTHCPVIASQNSSIPEVAGDGAILCENTESNLFEKSLLKLENTEFRNNLITRGVEQSSKFNWDITFNKYYEFYQELYNKY